MPAFVQLAGVVGSDIWAKRGGLKDKHLQLPATAALPPLVARPPLQRQQRPWPRLPPFHAILATTLLALGCARRRREATRSWCGRVALDGAKQRMVCLRATKEAKGQIPSRAQDATLRARVWDMLGLRSDASREEIKQAYKDFVRRSHPDLNPGKDHSEFAEKFGKLTREYNRIMKLNDDELWLESFDTGITRMATKRVDGPSLNPWERKFRQRARAQGLLFVDELTDEVDCQKQAELFLEPCDVDPLSEGCAAELDAEEVLREMGARPAQPTAQPLEPEEGNDQPSMEEQQQRGLAFVGLVGLAFCIAFAIFQSS